MRKHLVERYRGALLRASRRYLPEARAEDALQQAFISAWSALQRGDEVRDLRAWLYRIVHNTTLNQLRVAGYDYAEPVLPPMPAELSRFYERLEVEPSNHTIRLALARLSEQNSIGECGLEQRADDVLEEQ